jgi:PAS domain-containing protein
MWNRLRRWLDDIPSSDSLDRQSARLFEITPIGLCVAALALLFLVAFVQRWSLGALSVAAIALAILVSAGALILLRRGRAERLRAEAALRKSEEALRRQNAYLADLHETTLVLMNRLEVAELLQEIVERAARLLDAQHGYLYLVELDGAECELKVGIGRFHRKVGLHVKPGEGLTGRVWQTGQTIVVDEYDAWPGRTRDLPYGIYHTIVGTPLKLGAQVVGVLGFAHTDPARHFSEQEIILLNGFAQLAAVAFDNARLYADAQRELTARTQAIAALRDSEELYRLITENTRDLITLLDQEGRCVYASPSCSGILGYALVELIGTTIT